MTRLAAFTHLLSNVMRPKRFLSHLILTLSWCLKYKTRSRWEKFASSYKPFFRVDQITIRATARIARNTTHFSPWNGCKTFVYEVTNVKQHELLGFDASRSLPDVIPERANSLAVVEGVLSRFFQTTTAASAIRHVCQACSEVQAKKVQRVPCKSPGELFKKLDPGVQFQWERISSAV